jgi:hypothetical protein
MCALAKSVGKVAVDEAGGQCRPSAFVVAGNWTCVNWCRVNCEWCKYVISVRRSTLWSLNMVVRVWQG